LITILNKLKKGLRGDVKVHDLALEMVRRSHATWNRRIERQTIDRLNAAPALLSTRFRDLPKPALLSHFRSRTTPVFFQGFEEIRNARNTSSSDVFPQFAEITAEANLIASTHCWPLLGYPSIEHGDPVNWLRDPLSGKQWQTEYHADINLKWEAGSDIRVLWELNRFGHFLKLAKGFAVSGDESLAEEFFTQVVQKDVFARFDPSRARLRTFLRTCIDGLVANHDKAASRQKRGGGSPHLDFDGAREEIEGLEGGCHSPEVQFEKEWARGVFGIALRRLEQECASTGRSQNYALLQRYDLDDERPTYAELAQRFGVPVTDVTNRLFRVRRELRRIVLEVLRELTAGEDDFREEARALLGDGAV